jgi:selenoprotein W-related protein
MAQELLTTFQDELDEVTLSPGNGGIFEVSINDKMVWTFKEMRRFPEIKELKQIVRDNIAPDKNLGHSDKKSEGESCPL